MRCRRAVTGLLLALLAVILAGCSWTAADGAGVAGAAGTAPSTEPAPPPLRETASAVATPTLTVHASDYGPILSDGRGFALYAFTADGPGASRCDGACADAWPPYVLDGAQQAGPGVDPALLGTTRRADGRLQATYDGRPLYYYVGDREPGQVLCQNVFEYGGLWLVVRGGGALVR